ncbi:PTS sugar transporter subunit IIB [Liquorilactobacillus sicerae]|uniref:PTS sugar transporter subunit IIB n=1 Tax=Liquorilactobacillus sicerae TaxID=1416943 RepID=UPI0024812154|nr:PTS sugar transporter subunit IIB [Liquorilactobacillus sicerae]
MSEKTIMLCCTAGMSTSMMVSRMQKVAEQSGLDYKIFAKPTAEAGDILHNEKIDCILLGPQVKYLKAEFEKKYQSFNVPIAIIDMAAYGMMDGKKVLEQAQSLMS